MRRTTTIVATIALAACSTASPGEGRDVGAAVSVALAPAGAGSVTSESPVASASAGSSAAPASDKYRRAGPGLIACGDKDCTVPNQVCCKMGDATGCLPLSKPAPPPNRPDPGDEEAAVVADQIAQCMTALGDPELTGGFYAQGLVYCDESGDCPEGTGCCDGYYGSTDWVNACAPLGRDGSLPCSGTESCLVEGAACATKGLVCEGGKCLLPGRSVKCGNQTCSGATPVCCSIELEQSCTTEEKCEESRGMEAMCDSPRDCGPGQRCCAKFGQARCRGECDGQHALCESDKDCVGVWPGEPTCSKEGAELVGSCVLNMK